MVHFLLTSIAQVKSDGIIWGGDVCEQGCECCQKVPIPHICLGEIHAALGLYFIITTLI